MDLDYFNNYSGNFKSRNNPIDLWKDMLTYSSNLNGNWLLSKQVFYNCIVPTAEKDPVLFAKWINKMVKKSGVKIKSRADFLEAINYLRKSKHPRNHDEIKRVLYYLLESGLEALPEVQRLVNQPATDVFTKQP